MSSHDYVIVGAGSAGCVLAHRLSERPDTTVLLIEAGPEDTSALISMPRGYRRIHRDPRHMWVFPIDTDGDAGAWQGALVGGKVLGGSSAINSMLYARGHPEDYDGWAAQGAPGWGWADMLRSFKAIEDHELGESESRGQGGPLYVGAPRCRDAACAAVIEAGVTMGLPRKRDLNEGDQEGIGYFPATIEDGRRVSAARAFLAPIARRPNLTVLPATTVGRVLIEEGRAVGVACGDGRAPPSVHRATKEVVLSAGALQSPKLLQLSGIGPTDLLRALGIPVVADSPGVGANLRDHWGLRMQYRLLRSRGANHRLRGTGLRLEALRYALFGDGVLSTAPSDVGAFVRARPAAARPDAELQIAPWTTVPGREPAEIEREPGLQITVRSLQTVSRGSVRVRSSNHAVPATIRATFLSAPEDRDLMVDMIGFVRRLARQPALRPFLGEETFPGPAVRTAEEIVAVCQRRGTPGSHYAGTCRMGQDPMAVVDERLRVRGVAGLRVVDGSIMPTLVSGNTNGPIMAIAWRAADLIHEEG